MMYFTDSFSTKNVQADRGMSFLSLNDNATEIKENLSNIQLNLKNELIKSFMSEELKMNLDEHEHKEVEFKSGDIIYFCQPLDKHLRNGSKYAYYADYNLEDILDENRSDLSFKYFRITIQ